MATRTASVSGNWSNTATWGGAAVPVAGDDVVINAAITVTIDDSAAATIDIGSDTGANTGLAINGKLRYGASNANFNDPTIDHTVKVRGHINLASGGELNIGQDLTSGRVPSARKFILEINMSATPARNKYQFQWSGALKVAGYNRDAQDCRDLLAATANAASQNITLLATVPSTWAANDQLVISSTDKTSTHQEVKKISSLTGGGGILLTTVLSFQHLGAASEPLRGEVINAERNVIFRTGGGNVDITVPSSTGWCCTMASTATGSIQWARFQDLTYNANDAWCDYIGTSAGNIAFGSCMFANVDRGLFRARAAAGTGLSATGCSVYNVGGNSVDCVICSTTSASGVPYDFSAMWIVGCQSAGTPKGFDLVNIRAVKVAGSRVSGLYTGMIINCTSGTATIPTVAGLYDSFSSHSNMNDGIDIASAFSFNQYDVTGWWLWANTFAGLGAGSTGGSTIVAAGSCTITDLQLSSNTTPTNTGFGWANVRLINPVVTGNTTSGLQVGDGSRDFVLVNLVATGNTTNDLSIAANAQGEVDLINPNVGTYGTIANSTAWRPMAIRAHRNGQTTHYKTLTNLGQINEDTTTRHTASGYAWKFTPATFPGGARLRSPIMCFAVAANAPITITIWTAKDAAYNGAQQTMRLFGGMVQGIAADVTATAVNAGAHTPPLAGDWEQLSLTATPTEAGVVEVVYECDGTAGNVYFDDDGFVQ